MLSTVRKLGIIGSALFYYAVFLWLLGSTGFCANCAASQIWTYTVLASSPTWLVSLYCFLSWKTLPSKSTIPFRGCASGLLALAAVLVMSAWLAPQFTLIAFSQAYDIVYFGIVRFPFSSGMTVLVATTLGLLSFNLGAVLSRARSSVRVRMSALTCWSLVRVNFSLIAWLVLLMQRFGIANQSIAFGVLLAATAVIPIFSQFQHLFKKLPSRITSGLELLGLGSLATVLGILEFLTGFPLWHPFLIVTFCSSVAVCLSSTLGKVFSDYIDFASPVRRSRWIYLVPVLLIAVGVLLTWFYSHAAISVWVGLHILFQ